jgi:hypothetical protein
VIDHQQQLQELLANSRTVTSQINARSEELSQELQVRQTQISQLQVDMRKLQGELFDRINEGNRLRQQIYSLQASICWRLTWPMHWLRGRSLGLEGERNAVRTLKLLDDRSPFDRRIHHVNAILTYHKFPRPAMARSRVHPPLGAAA